MTEGLATSDWITLLGVFVAVVAMIVAPVATHFHSAIRSDTARATITRRLRGTRRQDLYRAYLGTALSWVDQRIGPIPSLRSLAVCIAISAGYSFGFFILAWALGGPGTLGQVRLLEPAAGPPWIPHWVFRVVAIVMFLLGAAGVAWWWMSALGGGRAPAWLVRYVGFLRYRPVYIAALWVVLVVGSFRAAEYAGVNDALAYSGGVIALLIYGTIYGGSRTVLWLLFPGLLIFSGSIMIKSGDSKESLLPIIFWLILPFINGLLDWISLSVSRWFGRVILADRVVPAALAITLGIAALDLLAAVALMFGTAWCLAVGLEASAILTGMSLNLDAYVEGAAKAPWTQGLWATVMVLSTLVPTAIHFVLALGVLLMGWSGNPLNRLAARALASGDPADFLFPQLYLTFAWIVPIFAVPALLIWGLAEVADLFALAIGPVETLPDLLRDAARNGIEVARALIGPVS